MASDSKPKDLISLIIKNSLKANFLCVTSSILVMLAFYLGYFAELRNDIGFNSYLFFVGVMDLICPTWSENFHLSFRCTQ